jgi:hypothetical protein
MTPAITTESKNVSYPKLVTAAKTIAIKPAAGPETLKLELDKKPTTTPPITPVIIPAKGGAPDATAIPKHKGNATKKTTRPDNVSVFIKENNELFLFINRKYIFKLMRVDEETSM